MANNSEYRIIPAYDGDGNEIGYYTREPDGRSGMTVSALAAFCGLAAGSTTAVSNLLTRAENADPETNDLPESLKPIAGKALRLETNDAQGRLIVPDEACSAVIEYYAFDARAYSGQDVAKQNFRVAGRAGIRVFIWSQTGFIPEVLRDSLRSNTTTYIERLENIRDHKIEDDQWTTFREGAEVLLLVEKEMCVPVDQLDLCDGSIGKHWSTYRNGKPWFQASGHYVHVFRDQRGEREARAYDLGELSYFRRWLREVYIPFHLPEYLAGKHGKLAIAEIYRSIGGMTDRVTEVTKISRVTPKQQKLYDDFVKLRQRLLKAQAEIEQQSLLDEDEKE
jgi:hypothetical protein